MIKKFNDFIYESTKLIPDKKYKKQLLQDILPLALENAVKIVLENPKKQDWQLIDKIRWKNNSYPEDKQLMYNINLAYPTGDLYYSTLLDELEKFIKNWKKSVNTNDNKILNRAKELLFEYINAITYNYYQAGM